MMRLTGLNGQPEYYAPAAVIRLRTADPQREGEGGAGAILLLVCGGEAPVKESVADVYALREQTLRAENVSVIKEADAALVAEFERMDQRHAEGEPLEEPTPRRGH